MKKTNIPYNAGPLGSSPRSLRYSNAAATGFGGAQSAASRNVRAATGTTSYKFEAGASSTYGSVLVDVVSLGSGKVADLAAQNPDPPTDFSTAARTYPAGTVLKLTATAAKSGKFMGWKDGVAAAVRTVTLNRPMHLVAQFVSAVQNHVVNVRCAIGKGRVAGPTGFEELYATDPHRTMRTYAMTVSHGTTVALEALPLSGFRFIRWVPLMGSSFQASTTDPSPSFRVTHDVSLTAIFEAEAPSGGGGTPPFDFKEKEFDLKPKPDPDPSGDPDDPSDDNGGGGDPDDNGGSGTPTGPASGLAQKAMAFARQWWWAILIAAFVAYDAWKGGRK